MIRMLLCLCLASCVCAADDWHSARARTVLAFAHAQELLEQTEKPTDGKCSDCYGTGKRGDGRFTFKCPTCNGTGKQSSGSSWPISGEDTPGEVGPQASFDDAGVKAPDPELYGVRYTADWCRYCKEFDRVHASQTDIPFQVIDVTDKPEVTEAAGVTGLPYFIICDRNLETVLTRMEGLQTAQTINAALLEARQKRRERKRQNESVAPKATVRIRAENAKTRSLGSGTILRIDRSTNTALVLTCAHVLDDDVTSVVVEALQQSPNALRGVVVRKNKQFDLAAILVQNDGSWTLYNNQIGTNQIRGTKAIAYGHPRGESFYTLTTEILGSAADLKIKGQDFVVFANDPDSGMSGGGLFVDGTLVGVVSMADRGRLRGFAVRSQEIREFLKGL